MSDLATGLAVPEGETAVSPADISANSSEAVLKSSVDNLCGTETEDEGSSSGNLTEDCPNKTRENNTRKLTGDERSTHVNPLLNKALVGDAKQEPISEGPQDGGPAEAAEACLLPEDEIAEGLSEQGVRPKERRETSLTELYAQAESFRKASFSPGEVIPEPLQKQPSGRYARQQTVKRDTTMSELYDQAESFRLKSCDPVGPEAQKQLQDQKKAAKQAKSFRVSALYADYSTPTAQVVDEDWWAVIIGVVFFVGAILVHMGDENFEFPSVKVWKTGKSGSTFSDNFFGGSSLVIMTSAVTLTMAFSFLRDKAIIAVAKAFALPFICISFIVFLSFVVGFEESLHDSGFKYPFWAVVFGMAIGNFLHFLAERKVGRLAIWAKMLQVGLSPVVRQTELFIKIGLVLLSVDLTHLLELFWRSLSMSFIVPPIVFLLAYYIGTATNSASKPVLIMLAAGISSTGVTACTLVSCVCGAGAEDRTIATVVIVLTSCIHMFIMPALANEGDLENDYLSGAWLGCVDVTANSVAGSSLISREAKEGSNEWWFCFGYVTIGLSTNVQKLLQYIDGTGILLLCFVAQSIDTLLSFAFAHVFYAAVPLGD
ncbi:hypothetical protein CYMTET_9291 [Cymbomonas tetramitiformis]|uniref:Uncharacterized protein n=1 Tax=Cymbomonas tetramitiformis TaxID=36881 RepID=A0AAE0LF94_9CHLO|nr:hypothetical protein CYMTET_9291 [Cymbomonas tetramitiformis]